MSYIIRNSRGIINIIERFTDLITFLTTLNRIQDIHCKIYEWNNDYSSDERYLFEIINGEIHV